MSTASMIDAFHKAVALEHTASLQYKQHALLVRGVRRTLFADFFASDSRHAWEHAHTFGHKIVALGGVPTVEVGAMVRQSLDLEEMLQLALALERDAMQAYLEAWTLAEDDVALRTMLEDHIATEQRDSEELEMSLSMVQTGAMASDLPVQVVE